MWGAFSSWAPLAKRHMGQKSFCNLPTLRGKGTTNFFCTLTEKKKKKSGENVNNSGASLDACAAAFRALDVNNILYRPFLPQAEPLVIAKDKFNYMEER